MMQAQTDDRVAHWLKQAEVLHIQILGVMQKAQGRPMSGQTFAPFMKLMAIHIALSHCMQCDEHHTAEEIKDLVEEGERIFKDVAPAIDRDMREQGHALYDC